MSVTETSFALGSAGAGCPGDFPVSDLGMERASVPPLPETPHPTSSVLFDGEDSFHLLVDAVTDYAIYMLDPQGRVVTWNQGAERNKGYTAEEVLGRHFSLFFLPEDLAAGLPAQELAAAAREGRYAVDGWRLRKGGEKFWAQVTLTAIRGPEGELRGFAKITRDMSAQKSAQEAIENRNAQLERYRIIIENVSEYVIFSMDPEGYITSWDAGAEKESGVPQAQMLGRHFSVFFPDDEVLAGVPERELAEAAREGKYAVDAWRLTPGGKRLWSSSVLNAVRAEQGSLTGFVRVARVMTEQKEAEDALRELNAQMQRYRIIVENLGEYGISMLDANGRYTDWGDGAAERRTGYAPEHVMGQEYDILATAEDRRSGLPRQELEEAARQGRCTRDCWKQRRDGSLFWATGVLTAVHDEAGNLTGFVRVGRDMTAQKRTEEALKAVNAQLQRYRIIIENVDEYSIYTLDAEGRVNSWAAGAQKLSGASEEEMLGRPYSTFFTPEEVQAGVPGHELAEAARTGRFASDSWRITPRGERVWSSGVLSALRDETGALTGYMRIAHMLTMQKQAEEKLRAVNAQLDRYRIIVENISDHIIFTLDAEGRFDGWSPGAQKVIGYQTGKVIGREYSILFTPEELEAGGPRHELAEAARTGHCSTVGWRVRRDGELYWCFGETTAIRDQAGRVIGFVRVARDMTRQKRAEEALAHLAAELEERVAERTSQLELTVNELRRKNEEVEALAQGTARDLAEKRVMLNEIHHRVKNNLQVVQSLLKMSVRSLPLGEARSVTMTTAQRVFAMAMVHEHLYQTKDLAGISVSKYLRDLFSGVADSNAALHGQVRIEFECDDILLNLDHAIPFGLLVNELLSNCLKHGFPDGRKGSVSVSVRRVSGAVSLVFQDDGIGLPDGFDAAKCTSMGLKLAASLAHQLGGTVIFSSERGCRAEALLTRH